MIRPPKPPPAFRKPNTSVSTTEYRVVLDNFHGPLDLLLYLVRRHELDVMDLSLATITEQFLEFQRVLEFLDLDGIGEFVVTAATLVEIKSREALPQPEQEEEAIADDGPQGDLIERLLQYKKLKEASRALEEYAAEWQERFPRLSDDRPNVGKNPAADRIKDVELWDLVSALGRVLKTKEIEKQTRIKYEDTPISVYIERIGTHVRANGRTPFSSFFEQTNRRSRIVGIFLAVLELLRHHAFRAEQPVDFGEIWILPPADEKMAEPPAAANA